MGTSSAVKTLNQLTPDEIETVIECTPIANLPQIEGVIRFSTCQSYQKP